MQKNRLLFFILLFVIIIVTIIIDKKNKKNIAIPNNILSGITTIPSSDAIVGFSSISFSSRQLEIDSLNFPSANLKWSYPEYSIQEFPKISKKKNLKINGKINASVMVISNNNNSQVFISVDQYILHNSQIVKVKDLLDSKLGVFSENVVIIATGVHNGIKINDEAFANECLKATTDAFTNAKKASISHLRIAEGLPGAINSLFDNNKISLDLLPPHICMDSGVLIDYSRQVNTYIDSSAFFSDSNYFESVEGKSIDYNLDLIVFSDSKKNVLGGFVVCPVDPVLSSVSKVWGTVSGGYPSILTARLAKKHGGTFLFLKGSNANIVPNMCSYSILSSKKYAGLLNNSIEKKIRSLSFEKINLSRFYTFKNKMPKKNISNFAIPSDNYRLLSAKINELILDTLLSNSFLEQYYFSLYHSSHNHISTKKNENNLYRILRLNSTILVFLNFKLSNKLVLDIKDSLDNSNIVFIDNCSYEPQYLSMKNEVSYRSIYSLYKKEAGLKLKNILLNKLEYIK